MPTAAPTQHPLDYLRIDDAQIELARAANADGIAPPRLYRDSDGVLCGVEFLLARNYRGRVLKNPFDKARTAAYILLQRGEDHPNIIKRTLGAAKQATLGANIASRRIWAAKMQYAKKRRFTQSTVIAAEDIPTRVQRGQTWQLGRHTLFCGSNADLKLPEQPDALITDPPYAINYHNSISGQHSVIRMAMHGDDAGPVAFPFEKYTRRGGAFLIFYAAATQQAFLKTLPPHWRQVDILIWDKLSSTLARGVHASDKEIIIYGRLDGPAHRKPPERGKLNSILRWRRLPKNIYHPTQKPVGLLKQLINYHTKPGDLVLEPYAGSGTTLLAAEETDRRCVAAEWEPHYCDVIIERWQDLTGEKAVLQDGR